MSAERPVGGVQNAAAAHDDARRAARMASFYIALSRTNQAILRNQDPGQLFHEVCRACVEAGHATIATVWLVAPQWVEMAGWAGPADRLFGQVPARWDHLNPAHARMPSNLVLREGVACVVNDYLHDSRGQPWHARAQAVGVRAVAVLPLRRAGAVVGTFTVYVNEVGFFDDALVALLDELAADLSFALDNFDREAARVSAEREAQAGYERFRRVFNATPAAAAIVALADARVVEVNGAMCRGLGLAREDVLGRTWAELGLAVADADLPRLRALAWQGAAISDFEVRVRTPSGAWRDLLINSEAIEFGDRDCRLMLATDVTERRAADLAHERQVAAEAASRAKSAFLSRMSHELRTPLNAMLGFTQLLADDPRAPLDERQRQHIELVRQAGWHLKALIDDALDVSRIEVGQLQVELRAVPLAELLDSTLRLCESQAKRHAVTLHAGFRSHADLNAHCDPVRMRQVMLNLLSNAIKYNRHGGQVRVDLAREGQQVRVEVSDTGIGMTPAQLAGLFEPFNRLGREQSEIEGTGIGLTLTRELVHLMQGRIVVDSEPGRGTRVQVILPAAARSASAGEVHAPPALAPNDAMADADPQGVVLYIEDNAVNLLLVAQFLARWPGVRFEQAEDGRSGLDLARALQPDVILMDMHLPDMDGYQLLQSLRTDPVTARLPVVVVSASAMPSEIERLRRAGAQQYWNKPLDFDRFLVDIRQLLTGHMP